LMSLIALVAAGFAPKVLEKYGAALSEKVKGKK